MPTAHPPTTSPKPTKPARRFAPVPIETTFDSYRVGRNPHGPTAELTPDPSPTTPQPPGIAFGVDHSASQNTPEEPKPKPKRRFAPQLIETSRRTKKAGQEGPATKHTDKTDITPGTNHIYVQKPKRAPSTSARPSTSSNGGNNASSTKGDEDVSMSPRFLPPRRQQSMKPHPNTRRGTRNISFHPGLETIASSESGSSSDENENENDDVPISSVPALTIGPPAHPPLRKKDIPRITKDDPRTRRESCDEEFSVYLLAVAAQEAHRQRELEEVMSAFPNGLPMSGVEHFFARENSDELLELPEPPQRHGVSQLLMRRKSTDPGWAVREMRAHAEQLAKTRATRPQASTDSLMDLPDMAPAPEDPLWTAITPSADSENKQMAWSNSPALAAVSPAAKARQNSRSPVPLKPYSVAPPAQTPPTGLKVSPFMRFPALPTEGDEESAEMRRMRQAASPPMLGTDLKFRRCPSPKQTRIESDHPWDPLEGKQRDVSEESGLWRGYCSTKANETCTPNDFHPAPLLATPGETGTPVDLFASSFGAHMNGQAPPTPSSPTRTAQTKGMQLLPSLDERLKREKVRKEFEERIMAEFDEAFVTQVYNYISLGYPATARDYDEELSKISGISMEELRKNDHVEIGKGFMLDIRIGAKRQETVGSPDSDETMVSPEEDEARTADKPPRWRALKLYIREWARQHPSLGDDENPLAWGVRARRGSWAI
ncbi:LOW QUALITY PROTEIN: uncharacterized protein B0I36DRAFT_370914 [Microdochium trichocladiopsis]|uniref:Uncharacterized protein n=1 Tax=Microdochium trichocladiopsis TaxID=1682393 RepID=A0A9P8YHG0_9PEZI|nr:LOW QUALITY PROTEIN: uncharacterized protein B0I36DRAFT_370914 [Microdochium trichocladiopsis]KAH7040072.1 LOW QUALITY PROTEIN: hypothetical protein B0I36DRAFT_370914 [Microdochium trichocladiopsis]